MKITRQLELLIYLLLFIGAFFIFNSSAIHSYNLFGNPYRFFILHVSWVLLGLIVFKIFSRINLDALIGISKELYYLALFFLLILAIAGILPCSYSSGFMPCINSANRWFVFNPVPLPALPFIGELTFQPSELAKFVLILFLSVKIAGLVKNKKKDAFRAFALYTGAYSILILLQPNMSTALLVSAIGIAIYFASGASIKPLVVLIPFLLLLVLFFAVVSPYRRDRLITYFKTNTDTQTEGNGYQVRQVKIALGSGGLLGVGFGASRQKYTYLPEAATDSIFAIIGEELGFLGSLVVVILFALILRAGFFIAAGESVLHLKLVAIGITCWIIFQFLLHLMANTGLIPYTGVPLPLISYGGSSMLFTLMGLGTLVNIGTKNKV